MDVEHKAPQKVGTQDTFEQLGLFDRHLQKAPYPHGEYFIAIGVEHRENSFQNENQN
jgi:hypothetical protein